MKTDKIQYPIEVIKLMTTNAISHPFPTSFLAKQARTMARMLGINLMPYSRWLKSA
jgi:hypothetical protein